MTADLPQSFTIPAQLIERWLGKDPSNRPTIDLTRLDWDHLYTAFDKSLISQARLKDAFVAYSQGNTDDANDLLSETSKLLIESQNSWRQFFAAVMSASDG